MMHPASGTDYFIFGHSLLTASPTQGQIIHFHFLTL